MLGKSEQTGAMGRNEMPAHILRNDYLFGRLSAWALAFWFAFTSVPAWPAEEAALPPVNNQPSLVEQMMDELETKGPMSRERQAQVAAQMVLRMRDHLQLTAKQADQARPFVLASIIRFQEIWQRYPKDMGFWDLRRFKGETDEMREVIDAHFSRILTPQQFIEYKAVQEKRRAKIRERMLKRAGR
jgi:hypothetical protein